MTHAAKVRTGTLDDIATDSHLFSIIAMDQRNTLRRMFTAVGLEASDDDLRTAKADVARVLTPAATGLLSDPTYGVPAIAQADALARGCGLLIAAEPSERRSYQGEPRTHRDPDLNAQWLLDQGIPAGRIAFAGDSAGGHLAMTVQLRARGQGLPLPVATMLLSPWIDLAVTGESLEYNEGKDLIFSKQWITDMAAGFLDGHDPRDPAAGPLHADLSGFGPLYLQVGDQELLLDDSRMLAQHARQSGIDVQLDEFPGQQHSFQMAAGLAPEADDAINRLAAWARPKLSPTQSLDGQNAA